VPRANEWPEKPPILVLGLACLTSYRFSSTFPSEEKAHLNFLYSTFHRFTVFALPLYLITLEQPPGRPPSRREPLTTLRRASPELLHALISAVKGGVVDPTFAGTHVQLVLYRPSAPRLERFEWDPGGFTWKAFGGAQYRYFVVRAPDDRSRSIFRDATCPVCLAHRVNHWWLYEKDPACLP